MQNKLNGHGSVWQGGQNANISGIEGGRLDMMRDIMEEVMFTEGNLRNIGIGFTAASRGGGVVLCRYYIKVNDEGKPERWKMLSREE